MSVSELHLDFSRNTIYETGAALLVVIACPANSSNNRCDELSNSLCAKALWTQYLSNPDDCTPISVKPQYAFCQPKTIDRDTDFVAKRLQERLVAGRMAIPFLQKAAFGVEPKLPRDIKRLSINEMAAYVLDDAQQKDVNNVERRIFAPSRPVIHLAAALAILGQSIRRSGFQLGLEHFLVCRALIEALVVKAQHFENFIAKDPEFPVKADKLIKVRLV